MDDASRNPVWRSLTTSHREFAVGDGRAWRYPAAIAPFVAVDDDSTAAAASAAALVAPGEAFYFVGVAPARLDAWELLGAGRIVQMHWQGDALPSAAPRGSTGFDVVELGSADCDAMVGLTAVAFPGFFRAETPHLGRYVGVRDRDALIAMAGERMRWPGACEVSAVCTHPDHEGRGHAAALSIEVMRGIVARGERPFLHASVGNDRAIRLYERLGFVTRAELPLWHLRAR